MIYYSPLNAHIRKRTYPLSVHKYDILQIILTAKFYHLFTNNNKKNLCFVITEDKDCLEQSLAYKEP